MNIFQFMRAELCACEFHDRQASWMWIWWELSFAKLIFMIAELGIVNVNLWEMSITNVNFMRAENCKCEFYKNWAFIWILRVSLWERSIANVSFLRVEVCKYECKFFSWQLSIVDVIYESWALQIWIMVAAAMFLWCTLRTVTALSMWCALQMIAAMLLWLIQNQ